MHMNIRDLTKFGKALSDPSRVRILAMIRHRPGVCVCELTAALGLAQPTVSRHLQVLEEAGLVAGRRNGPWVNFCFREPGGPDDPADMAARLLAGLAADPDVRALLAGLGTISRENLRTAAPASQEDPHAG